MRRIERGARCEAGPVQEGDKLSPEEETERENVAGLLQYGRSRGSGDILPMNFSYPFLESPIPTRVQKVLTALTLHSCYSCVYWR